MSRRVASTIVYLWITLVTCLVILSACAPPPEQECSYQWEEPVKLEGDVYVRRPGCPATGASGMENSTPATLLTRG
jgi:hypothetical protein